MISTTHELRDALANAQYPATPRELVRAAEERGASVEVLEDLDGLEGEQYESTLDVLGDVGSEDELEPDFEDEDERG